MMDEEENGKVQVENKSKSWLSGTEVWLNFVLHFNETRAFEGL
jgi:hypothetical protein